MEIFTILIVLFFILLFIFSFNKKTKKLMLAQNALVAKYTYNLLVDKMQKDIQERSVQILINGGFSSRENAISRAKEFTEREKFVFYAYAMADLGIEPMIKGILYNDNWNYIKSNPFVLLYNCDEEFFVVRQKIKNDCAIDISIS